MKYWTLTGLIATAIIALALPVYAFNEANRMEQAQVGLLVASVEQGQQLYAQNCVVCHGSDGQGIGAYPALDSVGVRELDYDSLFKVIERGRYNTAMAAWGVEEGGVLNDQQIEQLIALLQYGDWTDTAYTVSAMGLNPPTVIQIDISAETLAELASLPHGDSFTRALPLYAAHCIGCHGANGEGTAIAPALNDRALRQKRTDAELRRTITGGLPGTLMAGWQQVLQPDDISDLVTLIRYWDEIPAGTIPTPELLPIASTDAEVIAAGGRLYSIACSTCHGRDGQGSRMAPALNVQSFLNNTNDQAIKVIVSQGVPNTRMPAWGGRLSEAELNSLISFIRTWQPTAPAVAQPAPGNNQGGGPAWLQK